MLNFLFLFCLAVVPRYGAVDFVLLLAFCILLVDFFRRKSLILDRELLKVTCCVFLIFPLAYIAFASNHDPFGIVRLIKLSLLLILVPNAISRIQQIFFFKWFTLALLFTVILLYCEYFNIFGLRTIVNDIQGSLHHGREVSYRAKGLFAGYSAAGVSCGFIALYALYFSMIGKINPKIGVCLFVLSYIATFFTGRTGLLIGSLGVLVVVAFFSKKLFTIKGVVILTAVPLMLFLSVPIFFPFIDFSVVDITIIRTFEVFFNFQDTGVFSSESTTQIANTYKLPHTLSEIIYGNGFQHWGPQAMQAQAHSSDAGFIQTLFMYGIFSFFLYYFPVLYIWWSSVKTSETAWDRLYILIALPLVLVAELKGHYIYSSLIFVLVLFPFFYRKLK